MAFRRLSYNLKNNNYKKSVVLVNKISKGNKEYKQNVALKLASILKESTILDILKAENEADEIEFDENLVEYEETPTIESDKGMDEYNSLKYSTEDDSYARMKNIACEYSYDSDFKKIKVQEILDCSAKILQTTSKLQRTRIRNVLFLGAVVYSLRKYIKQEDETLLELLKNCYENNIIKKIQFLLAQHLSTFNVPEVDIWKLSYLKQALSLYELFYDSKLVRLPFISRNFRWLVSNFKKFKSIVFQDGTKELTEEGKYWATLPQHSRRSNNLSSSSSSSSSGSNSNNNNENQDLSDTDDDETFYDIDDSSYDLNEFDEQQLDKLKDIKLH
eukprot:TRINITY_DN2691_c0_g1_i2.p1 TRINITY_DN2691_c0_g1~~TRINITY_DN2691_c0_g1_i2.p1  ORF type:complete len:331 (+),score=74.59 TRINITY_DN2691_c0_g1_i2:126-1118(+)